MAGIRHMAASTTAPKSELASAGDPPERSWRSFVLPAITLLLFLAAAWAIHRELAAWTFADITAAVEAIPVDRLALAVLAGALSYAVLALYDPLALRHIGKPLPLRQAALAGFIGYAFSHAMGLPLLTGGAVRYRLYTAWGLGAGEIAGIVAFNSLTLWLGVAAMLCLGGLAAPAQVGALLHLAPGATLAVAAALGALLAGYVAAGWLMRRPLTIARLELRLAVSARGTGPGRLGGGRLDPRRTDALDSAAADRPGLLRLRRYLHGGLHRRRGQPRPGRARRVRGGAAAGAARRRPCPRRRRRADRLSADLLSAAAPRRGAAVRACTRREPAARPSPAVSTSPGAGQHSCCRTCWRRWSSSAAPSSWSPAPRRPWPSAWPWLAPVAPLALIELSHFLGSLAGLALLVLALGLRRRLDGAWWTACVVMAAGIVLSRWSRASTGRRRSIWRSSSPRCCRRARHSTARAGCSSSASRPVAVRDLRGHRRHDLARLVLLPPCRVRPRAVVAVPARGRRPPLPARHGRA